MGGWRKHLWYTSVIRTRGSRRLLDSSKLAMVNYYKVLRVSPDASTAQIKSAYRRLARKKHPDLNKGDKTLAREFAQVADAYRLLVDPHKRANYDRRRLQLKFAKPDSIFNSGNPHARRARQMAYERRYNAIIDRMIADERKESLALQRIIFPIVALFISTVFVAIFKPLFFSNSNIIGKLTVVALFVAGVTHLLRRLHDGMERYTYTPLSVHDSIFHDVEEEAKPFSRLTAITFLLAGIAVSLVVGLLIGNVLGMMNEAMLPEMYSRTLQFEFLFYPPIVVLVVDGMHSFFARFEY
ncbi:MAG: J domain-containing protein [Acidobacteriota bacterium]|nr:J domain-containing protein [Acidobacteriota bacterium]